MPQVKLPFTFSIITHQDEHAAKNTGVQAHILAPQHVQLHDVDHFPDHDTSKTVVLFPSDDALTVDQLEPGTVERAVIIDSKWRKAKELLQHSVFDGMRRVKLTHTKSAFWRFHTAGVAEEGVCTVEAMLHFLRAMAVHGKLSHSQMEVALSDIRQQQGPDSVPTTAQGTRHEGAQSSECQPLKTTTSDTPPAAGHHDARDGVARSQDVTENDATAVDATQQATQQTTQEAAVPAADASGMNREEQAAFHAFDDLMWLFVQQHKWIQIQSAKRLEERKANRDQQQQGGAGRPSKKKKTKNDGPNQMPAST